MTHSMTRLHLQLVGRAGVAFDLWLGLGQLGLSDRALTLPYPFPSTLFTCAVPLAPFPSRR